MVKCVITIKRLFKLKGGIKMVKCIAVGSDSNGKFYVQSCCTEEHLGQKCDCRSFGENLSKRKADKIAEEKARGFQVPIEYWT